MKKYVLLSILAIALAPCAKASTPLVNRHGFGNSQAFPSSQNITLDYFSSESGRTGKRDADKRRERERRKKLAHSFWREEEDSAANGPARIEINLRRQVALFYRGDRLVGQSPVSTGREGFETKSGKYSVLGKELKHFSNMYGEFVDDNGRIVKYGEPGDKAPPGTHYKPSPMPFFMRISDSGMGLHAGYLPGYPASHGCIRMPSDMANKFYKAVSIGASVEVID